jgi:hypothetical protein
MADVVRVYHIDRILALHGWTRISDTPRQYEKSGTVLTTNRTGVRDVSVPSGSLEPFIPAMYAPLASAGQLMKLI